MLEILRDGVWQFVEVVLALIALAVTWAIGRRQWVHKELAFGVVANLQLLTVSEDIAQRVKVSFEGAAIENLQMIVVGLKKSGNSPQS